MTPNLLDPQYWRHDARALATALAADRRELLPYLRRHPLDILVILVGLFCVALMHVPFALFWGLQTACLIVCLELALELAVLLLVRAMIWLTDSGLEDLVSTIFWGVMSLAALALLINRYL